MFGGNYFGQQFFAGGTPYTPQNLTQTYTETVNIATVFNFSMTRSFLESLSIVNVFDATIVFALNLLDTIGVTDSLTKVGSFLKSLTETVVINDIFLKMATKLFTEVVTLVQSFTKSVTRRFGEVVTIVGSFTSQVAKNFIETITLVQGFLASFAKVFKETITLNEVFSKLAIFGRASVLLATQILKPLISTKEVK